ncbi:MAG: peptidoglycan DD-metalloendopeptidase family protein [Clostridia bacterium]|nr:peptidoglycan DD-metalloendopeptidase family protein [Clostridia bacterium]
MSKMKGAVVIKAICEKIFAKKKLIGTLCGILAFVIAFLAVGQFLAVSSHVEAATDANLQAMENKLDALKKQKNEISKKLTAAKNNKAEAVKYKSYIDQQMNIVYEEVTTINELISSLDSKVKDKEAEIKAAKTERNKQLENFKQVMLLTYEGGNASYIEMVLSAENFYDFLTRVERVSSLMDYCNTVMEEMKTLENKLSIAKIDLETSLNAQLEYKEELILREAELETLQVENETYLKNLEKDISGYQSTYNSYAEEEKKIDAEIEKYLKELQEKENSAYVGGEFIWPVPRSWSRISSPYGWRTLNGKREHHNGIDIPASKGTKIYASNGGKVITATWHYSYGNYVIIDHGGGKATLYAHASKLNCKVGDKVKQGDVIAYVGTTGHSTGNHLHFEVRINGAKQNPLNYVKQP